MCLWYQGVRFIRAVARKRQSEKRLGGNSIKPVSRYRLVSSSAVSRVGWLAGDGPVNLFLFEWDTAKIVTVPVGRLGMPAPETTLARPQFTVPGGVWAGALLADGTTWAMTGAQTTPAWDPRDSRDPNMPKRAPNASMLFMEKNRALIEGEGFRGNGIKGEAG